MKTTYEGKRDIKSEAERRGKEAYERAVKSGAFDAIKARYLASDPALNAALIKLRDANVTDRTARAPFHRVGGYSARGKEAKALRQRFEIARQARDHALDDLLAIIDPGSVDAS